MRKNKTKQWMEWDHFWETSDTEFSCKDLGAISQLWSKEQRQPWFLNKTRKSQVPLAHACNPGYSGGSNQELMVQSKTLSQKKNPSQKRAGGGSPSGSWVQTPVLEKKKKTQRKVCKNKIIPINN
jgi:hypothetical protein